MKCPFVRASGELRSTSQAYLAPQRPFDSTPHRFGIYPPSNRTIVLMGPPCHTACKRHPESRDGGQELLTPTARPACPHRKSRTSHRQRIGRGLPLIGRPNAGILAEN